MASACSRLADADQVRGDVMYICICVYIYVCMYVHVYISMYIYHRLKDVYLYVFLYVSLGWRFIWRDGSGRKLGRIDRTNPR